MSELMKDGDLGRRYNSKGEEEDGGYDPVDAVQGLKTMAHSNALSSKTKVRQQR
jgi:hypothetical protein